MMFEAEIVIIGGLAIGTVGQIGNERLTLVNLST